MFQSQLYQRAYGSPHIYNSLAKKFDLARERVAFLVQLVSMYSSTSAWIPFWIKSAIIQTEELIVGLSIATQARQAATPSRPHAATLYATQDVNAVDCCII